MKKLLAADYDGTFKSNIENLYININVVSKFMQDGNKFVIATGREYRSIKRETKKYDIDYDYLVCNNGLVIFDNNDNIMYSSILNKYYLNFIYDILREDSNVEKLSLYNLYGATDDFDDVLEIYARFKNIDQALAYKDYFESLIRGIKCVVLGNKMYIGNDINKANAIAFLSKIKNINSSDIYTVGDDINDLEMLKMYNGYKMLSSSRLMFKPIKTTSQVHTLVKKIRRK